MRLMKNLIEFVYTIKSGYTMVENAELIVRDGVSVLRPCGKFRKFGLFRDHRTMTNIS